MSMIIYRRNSRIIYYAVTYVSLILNRLIIIKKKKNNQPSVKNVMQHMKIGII